MQAQNLIGMINEFTKKRNIPVGKIDIFKNFSFFEIDSEFENTLHYGTSSGLNYFLKSATIKLNETEYIKGKSKCIQYCIQIV